MPRLMHWRELFYPIVLLARIKRNNVHRLLIQLHESPQTSGSWQIQWWLYKAQTQVDFGQSDNCQQLIQMLPERSGTVLRTLTLIVIPPAQRIHVRQLQTQATQRRYFKKIVPFLMENSLAHTVESQHIIGVSSRGKNQWGIAIERDLMGKIQALVESLKVLRSFVIPLHFFARHADSETLVQVLDERFMLDQDQLCYLPPTWSVTESMSLKSTLTIDSIIPQLEKSRSFQAWNLLQGEFDLLSDDRIKRLKRWSMAIFLAVAALLAYAIQTHLEVRTLNQQATLYETSAANVFLQIAPEEGRVVNLTRQLAARLEQKTIAQPTTKVWSAYELLAVLDQARNTLGAQLELKQVSARKGLYQFEWVAPSRVELESLLQFLMQQGLRAELEQVVRRDGRFYGTYQAEGVMP